MEGTFVLTTGAGPVELRVSDGGAGTVVLFPGGHCSAVLDQGHSLYTDAGYRVVAFSRPGYGRTRVGRLSPTEFVPGVADALQQLGFTQVDAAVGVSFGGPTAVQFAVQLPKWTRTLILHSAAPSALPYPDSLRERRLTPLIFSRATEGAVWGGVRALLRGASELTTRRLLNELSLRRDDRWIDQLSPDELDAARTLFRGMRSGSGFLNDVRHAGRDTAGYRAAAQRSVVCRTLVTASRDDAGVDFAHAENFVRTIPRAVLYETGAASHLYWLGPQRARLAERIRSFLVQPA